jgi:hypothetical protein
VIVTSFTNRKSGNVYSLIIHVTDKAEATLLGNVGDTYVKATGYGDVLRFRLLPGTNKAISDGADPLKLFERLIVQGRLSLSDVLQ